MNFGDIPAEGMPVGFYAKNWKKYDFCTLAKVVPLLRSLRKTCEICEIIHAWSGIPIGGTAKTCKNQFLQSSKIGLHATFFTKNMQNP